MIMLLKFHVFISRLLGFSFCVLSSSHSNSENHSFSFLKFYQSMSTMMRMCLLWVSLTEFHCKSCNPCELVANHIGKLVSIHVTELSNLDFKKVVLFNRSCHFCLSLYLSFQYIESRFACNTSVIVDASSIPPVSLMSSSCNKTLNQINK